MRARRGPAGRLTFHGPSTVASSVSVIFGQRARRCAVAGLRKTTKTVPQGSRCSGTVVRPFGDLVRGGLGLAGLGMPQLRRFAGDAEGCIDGFVAVAAVVEEVDVAIGQLAMHKDDPRVGLGLGVVEVRSDIQRLADAAAASWPA